MSQPLQPANGNEEYHSDGQGVRADTRTASDSVTITV